MENKLFGKYETKYNKIVPFYLPMRIRLDEDEIYYIKRTIYLSLVKKRDEPITEETRTLCELLRRLLHVKPGAPPKEEVTQKSLWQLVLENRDLIKIANRQKTKHV